MPCLEKNSGGNARYVQKAFLQKLVSGIPVARQIPVMRIYYDYCASIRIDDSAERLFQSTQLLFYRFDNWPKAGDFEQRGQLSYRYELILLAAKVGMVHEFTPKRSHLPNTYSRQRQGACDLSYEAGPIGPLSEVKAEAERLGPKVAIGCGFF